MTTPVPATPPPDPVEQRPAALRRTPQILALVALVLAASVPLALAFGVDVCAPLEAVGLHLDACAPPAPPSATPATAPVDDEGSPQ